MRIVRSIIFFTTLLLLLMVGSFYLLKLFSTEVDSSDVVSPVSKLTEASEKKLLSFFSSELEDVVNAALDGSQATYSVVIKNLKTGEMVHINEEQVYDSASLYKLWLMAATFKQLEQDSLQENQVLSADVAELNKIFNIASESAELNEGVISLSVKNALEKAITISDNYAALLLTTKVRILNMTEFLQEVGMDHSYVGTLKTLPKTTASDTALFYEKLYRGELVSKKASGEMLEILKRQQFNDRIPKYLPKNTLIAHKTGELGSVKHDAGIVFTPKGDYILVILSDSNNPQAAAERMAQISKSVYDYFLKQN